MQSGELSALSPDEKRALLRRLLEQQPAAPLSAGQQWLWLLQQLAPGSASYHFPVALHISSTFDVELMRRSLQELVNRHAAFRTIFTVRNGQPAQAVRNDVTLVFDTVDVSSWSAEELRTRVTEEADHSIDLTTGPVFRCTLFRRHEADAVLLLVWHHLVLDGWSLAFVLEELGIIYAAYARGREHELPPVAPYTDFVQWQQTMLAGPDGARQAAFWLQQLDGAERLELTTDRKRPTQRSYRGGSLGFTIGESLTTDVGKLAAMEGTTAFVVLLAAFEALLHRVSGQDRVLISFPVAGRTESRFAKTAGYFVNQLAVAAHISAQMTFRELVAQTRGKVLAALEHQDYHLSLLPQSEGPTGTTRSRVMFVLQKSQGYQLELPRGSYRDSTLLDRDAAAARGDLGGLQVELFPLDCRTARFDLELHMMERGGALLGWLQYDIDLFEERTARSLVERFQRLLASVIDDADQRVSEVDILSEDERQALLFDWNRPRREWSPDGSIADLFECQVRITPDAVAATCGSHQIRLGDLDVRANRVAQWLRRSGARPQDIVGLCVPRSVDMLVTLLGIVKAGCVYLPLDPANPHERLKFMLKDSGAEFVITSSETCGWFRRSRVQQLCLHCDASAIRECPEIAPNRTEAPLLYVVYTSGSTGEPKGVVGTQTGALNRFHWMWDRYPFSAGEVSSQTTTLGFVDAVWEIFGPLLRGVPITIIPDEDVRDIERLVGVLERDGVTRITLVPSLLRVLLESDDLGHRLSRLRYWSCSGEALEPELARKFRQLLPTATLLNLYGCSEAAADSCYFEIESDWSGDRVLIGRPIANTQVLLLDRYDRLVPPGSVGEIHIGGSGLAAGYLRRPELTEQRFIPNPFVAGERLYRTGDLGRYLPDGNLQYFGRTDQQLKIRGNRVELCEVEATLRSHPEVESAAVQGVTESSGDRTLVAYVVTRSGSLTDGSLRMHLASRLPSYMLPSHFVRLDAMPLTSTGKINWSALPTPSVDVRSPGYVAPRTETERVLAELWAQVLNVPQLGVEDDFFELGGHSILALQAASRASRLFKRQLPVALLNNFRTVASFAAHIDGAPAIHRRHQAVAVEPRGTKPPVFWIPGGAAFLNISRLGELAGRLGPDQPFYGLGTQRPETMSEIDSVPDRARAYVEVIREVQPDGPYFLAGFCLGGVIAFEAARQLNAQGQRVAFLGLVNTWMPATSIPGSQWLVLYLQRVAYHARAAIKPGAGPAHRYLLRQMRMVRQALRRNGMADGAGPDPHSDVTGAHVLGADALLRATIRLSREYVPQHFDGKMHVFVSEEPDLAGVSGRVDPRRAWRRVCADCEMIRVRGGHDEMLYPPAVELFAKEFRRCLRAAQDRQTVNADLSADSGAMYERGQAPLRAYTSS